MGLLQVDIPVFIDFQTALVEYFWGPVPWRASDGKADIVFADLNIPVGLNFGLLLINLNFLFINKFGRPKICNQIIPGKDVEKNIRRLDIPMSNGLSFHLIEALHNLKQNKQDFLILPGQFILLSLDDKL